MSVTGRLGARIPAATDILFLRWPTLGWNFVEVFDCPGLADAKRQGLWIPEVLGDLLGSVCMVRLRWRRLVTNHRHALGGVIVVTWVVTYSVFVFGLVPLEWPRYYQEIVPPFALLVGIATAWSMRALRTAMRRDPRPGPA